MKKIISFAIIASALSISFVSCSKDDDSSSSSNVECVTCNYALAGIPDVTICDNGDGTVTLTTSGVENVQTLDYDTYIQTLTLAGASCN